MEPNVRRIHPPFEIFYIESMLFNTASAARSIARIDKIFTTVEQRSSEDHYELLHGRGLLSELQNLIVHAGALSRYFWPVDQKHQWRGVQLQQALSLSSDNVLRNRDLRNAIEHFDERLDDYFEKVTGGYFFPEYIGPKPDQNGTVGHFFAHTIWTLRNSNSWTKRMRLTQSRTKFSAYMPCCRI